MVKVKSKETENKRRQCLCDSDQIALLVRSASMKTPKKVVFFSFGHNSFGSDVIDSFLHNSLLLSNGVINRCSVSVWNEIDLAETLTGRDDLSKKKKNNSMLKKLEDSELEKLVEDLVNLVDQEANKRNPNSDNHHDLLDLQDLDSDSYFNNNFDDHLLMDMLESELKNCKDMKKSELMCSTSTF